MIIPVSVSTTNTLKINLPWQNNLDPEKFLRAPRYVIEQTFTYIKKKYGSTEGYLDEIGFDEEKRKKLKEVLTY